MRLLPGLESVHNNICSESSPGVRWDNRDVSRFTPLQSSAGDTEEAACLFWNDDLFWWFSNG